MKAIVIAAGRGSRLGHLTDLTPKCLLPVGGTTILGTILSALRAIGVTAVTGTVGYRADDIAPFLDETVMNAAWSETNVLGSFLAARSVIESCANASHDLVVTYSDAAVDQAFFVPLSRTDGDLVLLCDAEWRPRYEGRTAHPITEAELVRTKADRYLMGGKPQSDDDLSTPDDETLVEFTGSFFMSPRGCQAILEIADDLLESTMPESRRREYLQRAYLTDLFNAAVRMGIDVSIAQATAWWHEVDTPQDLERARLHLG